MPLATVRSAGRPKNLDLAKRRQLEIIEGAIRLFAAEGYPGTDVQVLADRLGIGKGTIYRYFSTKEKLFLAAVDHGMKLMSENIHAFADKADDPLEKITSAVKAYLCFFDKHPEFVELFIQERAEFKSRKKPTYFVHREANLGPWRDLLTQMIKTGRLRPVPVERLLDVINDLLYGTIFTNHFAGRKKSFQRQTEDVLDILLQGILPRPEVKSR